VRIVEELVEIWPNEVCDKGAAKGMEEKSSACLMIESIGALWGGYS